MAVFTRTAEEFTSHMYDSGPALQSVLLAQLTDKAALIELFTARFPRWW